MTTVTSCPNCTRLVHPNEIVKRGRGKRTVCIYCEEETDE